MGGSEFSQKKWGQESDWRAWCGGMLAEELDDGVLLNHRKERNWATFRDVDGPRICHTEWSKLEREKQISYPNASMWNPEKWHRWTYLQGRNREAGIEHEHIHKSGKERAEQTESSINTHSPPCVRQMLVGSSGVVPGAQLRALCWPGGVGSGGWEGGSRGRGHMSTENWLTSLSSRKQHNIVKQLYSNF